MRNLKELLANAVGVNSLLHAKYREELKQAEIKGDSATIYNLKHYINLCLRHDAELMQHHQAI